MKIIPSHLAYIENAIGKIAPQDVKVLRAAIVQEGRAKDVEKRLRWDLSYRAGLSQWFCTNVYPYANDDHIDTALRAIVRKLYG